MAGEAAGAVAGDRTPELIGLIHDIVGLCGGAVRGSSPSSSSSSSPPPSSSSIVAADALFKKDCTDLVRRISILTYLFEEIRDSKNAAFDSEISHASSTSCSHSSWSSDLVLALISSKRLISVARNFRSTSSSVSFSLLLSLLPYLY